MEHSFNQTPLALMALQTSDLPRIDPVSLTRDPDTNRREPSGYPTACLAQRAVLTTHETCCYEHSSYA